MSKSAVSTSPKTVDVETLKLFAEDDLAVALELMSTTEENTCPVAYKLIKRAIQFGEKRERLTILGFAIAKVVGQEDEIIQVREALEIHEAVRYANLEELVENLRPEDRKLNVMPPDPITLLGQEGLSALDGLARFVLKRAYQRTPDNQKILAIIQIDRTLAMNGKVKVFLKALEIYWKTW